MLILVVSVIYKYIGYVIISFKTKIVLIVHAFVTRFITPKFIINFNLK